MSKSNSIVIQILKDVIPFRFLSLSQIDQLARIGTVVEFKKDEVIIQEGNEDISSVYVLLTGLVEVGNEIGTQFNRKSLINEGHYFGEWEAIFPGPRLFTIRSKEKSTALKFNTNLFNEFLENSPTFSESISTILKDRQGIFKEFDQFYAELMRGVTFGHLRIDPLLPFYKNLEPALHRYAKEEGKIDISALRYVIPRLPDNVTHCFAFLLRDEFPQVYRHADEYFNEIQTLARRRSIWEMIPGKNLVLLRNGNSDLLDLVTCLCVYAVEAQKIRMRIYGSNGLAVLNKFLGKNGSSSNVVLDVTEQNFFNEQGKPLYEVLGYSEAEWQGLKSIWGNKLLLRIYEITLHREMFTLDVRRQRNNYNTRKTEEWTSQLAQACRELLQKDPSELNPDTKVHIISSNTHSVTNCLNPWFQENREEIIAWGKKERPEVVDYSWKNEDDLLYALAPDYFDQNDGLKEKALSCAEKHGIHRLERTVSTGIQVQIIDAEALCGLAIDKTIQSPKEGCKDVIINIDYAFGEQAEHIIRNLILLFHNNLASVNFIGKAGSLCGKRGDVLVPNRFIDQSTDAVLPIPHSQEQIYQGLQEELGSDQVHSGALLTVAGTLLQNRTMLYFYQKLWNVIGIEMEGSFYHRQVMLAQQTDQIPSSVDQRYVYYVSDTPLDSSSTLSKPLKKHEGIPPLYAITRTVLNGIFS